MLGKIDYKISVIIPTQRDVEILNNLVSTLVNDA